MKANQFLRTLGPVFVLAFLMASCQSSPQRESKPSADWSRSVAVGNFVTGSIGIVVDSAGEKVHLAWPANVGEGTYIRYVQLNSQAEPVVEKNLEFPGLLRTPRLVPAEGGKLHLFWGSRPAGGKVWAIWHVLLDAAGEPTTPIAQVSQPGVNVGSYVVVTDQNGGVLVAWDSSGVGEIYLQHLNQSGVLLGAPALVASGGDSPSIWLDLDENVHIAWQGAGNLMYARSSLQALSPTETAVIGDMPEGTGKSLVGPYLGTEGEWAYVFWSVLNQSGLEAGTGYTAYTSFPVAAPAKRGPTRLLMSYDEVQPYAPYQGSLALSQLAPPVEAAWASSDFILHPSIMQGSQPGVLAVAVSMNQAMRLDQHLQIAVAVFDEGQFVGYTLGTKTENISDNPVLFIDAANHLHLAWREGAAGNSVFYATTEPEAIAALEHLNAGDIVNAIFQGGMEGLVGITFLPILGFGWLLPGALVVGIVKLFRDQDNLTKWQNWIPLILALLLFYFAKFSTLPTITTYVPFSAWLDFPAGVGGPLRVIMPALIFTIAALVANQVRQRKSDSAVMFYIVFALADGLLTLAIYGVNLLGVY